MPVSSPGKVALATAAFAAVHSALATAAAKQAFERRFGPRARNALYRPAYNVIAVATSAWLVGRIARQPSRTLYRVRGVGAGILRLGQAAAAVGMLDAVVRTRPLRFAGLPGLWAWLRGKRRVPREPQGQNPPLTADGCYAPGGSFRLTRNPANFWPVPLLWLNPRMTDTLAAFNAVATLYFYVGSLHTDRRLRQAYGATYESHGDGNVPVFVPRLTPAAPAAHIDQGAPPTPAGDPVPVAPQLVPAHALT